MTKRTNEFASMAKLTKEIEDIYLRVCKECKIPADGMHRRTIEKLIKPFTRGYFTLAVVGKVSAGKSTFINALLGCKGLLPTGHDQTTCGLTYIEYGEKEEAVVTYGDGRKEVIKGDVSNKIKNLVAIPHKFHDLPVNALDEMILGEETFDSIWKVKGNIEKETNCPKIDEHLLKQFLKERPISKVVQEVRIKYPFTEELRGWRIVDTPGIGAIGGIEDRTRQLLDSKSDGRRNDVDAIIFLQDGSETLDQKDSRDFVKNTLENLSDSVKERLFYVLTHSAEKEFILHRDEKIDTVKKFYDAIKRITYTDSLLFTYLNDYNDSRDKVELIDYEDRERPSDWDEEEWESVVSILHYAERYLKKTLNEPVNNETLLRLATEWAHFDDLKNEINKFAKKAKEGVINEIINCVSSDFEAIRKEKRKNIETLNGGLSKIHNQLENVKKNREEYNSFLKKAEKEISIDNLWKSFNYFDVEIEHIKDKISGGAVRTSITNLYEKTERLEESLFIYLKNTYRRYLKESIGDSIELESIDFKAIEDAAEARNHEKYLISAERVEKHTSAPNERIPAKWGTRTNKEKAFRDFKADVLQRVRYQRDSFKKQLKAKADDMLNLVREELNKINNEEKRKNEEFERDYKNKDAKIQEYTRQENVVKAAEEQFNNVVSEYRK